MREKPFTSFILPHPDPLPAGEGIRALAGDGMGDCGIDTVQVKPFFSQLTEAFKLGRVIEV